MVLARRTKRNNALIKRHAGSIEFSMPFYFTREFCHDVVDLIYLVKAQRFLPIADSPSALIFSRVPQSVGG